MAKKGTPFEQAVRDVTSLMDPHAKVTQGEWIDGPDCRRDADVMFEGSVFGRPLKGIIECKDYDRSTSGPVGIELVEQLDSKRRDFDFNFACICSNAGFTEGALRKARRIGIGLIGAMREGDNRIKHKVRDVLYHRRINVKSLVMSLLDGASVISLQNAPFNSLTFKGAPVGDWICREVMRFIGSNPIVNGTFDANYRFQQPLSIATPTGPILATQLRGTFEISGAWFRQEVLLTASNALYDWIRRYSWMAPGAQQFSVTMDTTGGELIKSPPDEELAPSPPGGLHLKPLLIHGLRFTEPVVDLSELIEPDDLEAFVPNLPKSCYESTPDFDWSWEGWKIQND